MTETDRRNEFTPELNEILQQDFPETVPAVIARMAEIEKALGGRNSGKPLAAFNFLYKDITSTILRVLQNSPDPIENHQGVVFDPNPLANLLHRSVELLEATELAEFVVDPDDADSDEPMRIELTTSAVRVDSESDPEGQVDESFRSLRGRLEQSFLDPEAMELLDIEFARLYFSALKAWSVGEVVPRCWGALFQKWDDADGEGPFSGALLGVNAHINHDLAIAVHRTHEALGAEIVDGSDRHADYLTINDVFLVQTPLLYERLKGVLVGPKRVFYELMGGAAIEQASQFLIKETRELAWDHARGIQVEDVPAPMGTIAVVDEASDVIAGAVADGILSAFF